MGQPLPYTENDMDCIKCGGHSFYDRYYDNGEMVPDECRCADCGTTMAIEDAERTHQGLTWEEFRR